jgi:hypothetical protein
MTNPIRRVPVLVVLFLCITSLIVFSTSEKNRGVAFALLAGRDIHISPLSNHLTCKPDEALSCSFFLHTGSKAVDVLGLDTSCSCLVVDAQPPFQVPAFSTCKLNISVPEGFPKGSPNYRFTINVITKSKVVSHILSVNVSSD